MKIVKNLTPPAQAVMPFFSTQIILAAASKGMVFEVQASTDLNQWSPLTTLTNLTGTLEFTDTDAANEGRRFYRTLLR